MGVALAPSNWQARGVPRLIIWLSAGVLLLLLIAVGADRAALYFASRGVAAELIDPKAPNEAVNVQINGFPFLTQALSGSYDDVDVTMTNVPATSELVLTELNATLHGVHAPLGQVLSGGLTNLPVDSAEAVGQVSFASLEKAAVKEVGVDGAKLKFARAAADRIAVTAAVETPLGDFTLKGQAKIGVSKGKLAVTLLPKTITGLPEDFQDDAASLVDLSGLNTELPFGFVPTSVTVTPTGLSLRASGTHLNIS